MTRDELLARLPMPAYLWPLPRRADAVQIALRKELLDMTPTKTPRSILIEPRVKVGRWFLPLRFTVMCLNDETLSDVRDGACPTCGSRTLVLLSTWLRAGTGQKAEKTK
jgi:hypothetical protein